MSFPIPKNDWLWMKVVFDFGSSEIFLLVVIVIAVYWFGRGALLIFLYDIFFIARRPSILSGLRRRPSSTLPPAKWRQKQTRKGFSSISFSVSMHCHPQFAKLDRFIFVLLIIPRGLVVARLLRDLWLLQRLRIKLLNRRLFFSSIWQLPSEHLSRL